MNNIRTLMKAAAGPKEHNLTFKKVRMEAAKQKRRKFDLRVTAISIASSCSVVFLFAASLYFFRPTTDSIVVAADDDSVSTGATSEQQTTLFSAIRAEDPVAVQQLVTSGADLEERTSNGQLTPLMVATFRDSSDTVEILLAADADPLAISQANETSYEIAARAGAFESFNLLVTHSEPSPFLLDKCLLAAIRSGDSQTVERVLTLGARVGIVGDEALTFAHAQDAPQAIIDLLVSAGVTPQK